MCVGNSGSPSTRAKSAFRLDVSPITLRVSLRVTRDSILTSPKRLRARASRRSNGTSGCWVTMIAATFGISASVLATYRCCRSGPVRITTVCRGVMDEILGQSSSAQALHAFWEELPVLGRLSRHPFRRDRHEIGHIGQSRSNLHGYAPKKHTCDPSSLWPVEPRGSHQLLTHRDTQRRAPLAPKSADYSCAFLNLCCGGCWVQRSKVDVVVCVVANFHFGFGK